MVKIYLDVDDVVTNWVPTFCKKYDCPIPTTWTNPHITRARLDELSKDRNYWINLPVRHRPNFVPSGFLSARSVPKRWTYEFMKLNQIPGRSNINHVPWNTSKIEKLRAFGCDIFIDDKDETFEDCHKAGIFCLLMDTPWNQHIKTPFRIFNLDYNTIINKYRKWQSCRSRKEV
jgi:hypothetical protein